MTHTAPKSRVAHHNPFLVLSTIIALLATAFAALTMVRPVAAASTTMYVDATRPNDTGDGASWLTAKQTLQSALDLATSPTAIWVAGGTYYPDEGGTVPTDPRNSTFSLKDGVAIYGGFAGGETLLSQRDPATNLTRLSGDLQQNDTANFGDNTDNAYHVVTSNANTSTAILDGFTITAGNANSSDPDNQGAGISVLSGSPQFTNLTISGNTANF